MNPPQLRPIFLPAVALCLALAGAAEARPIDCSAEGQTGAAKCLVATERVQPGRDPLSSGAGRSNLAAPVLADEADTSVASGDEAQQDELPLLSLFLAAIGIVAFMAHRRIGA